MQPTTFLKWSKERQNQHLHRFQQYFAPAYTTYTKPDNAGKKGRAGEKRRVNEKEADTFVDSIPTMDPVEKAFTPVKI